VIRTSLCLASYVAVNMTLLAFAADRVDAVDMDRKPTAPAADAPCSNRSARDSSQLTARCDCGAKWDNQTDRRTDTTAAYYASSVNTRVSVRVSVNLVARIRLLRTSKELG